MIRLDGGGAPPKLRPMLSALIAIIALASAGDLAAKDFSSACSAKPLVVKIHADWCGSCRSTQATWEKVIADISDQATANDNTHPKND